MASHLNPDQFGDYVPEHYWAAKQSPVGVTDTAMDKLHGGWESRDPMMTTHEQLKKRTRDWSVNDETTRDTWVN